MNLTKAQKAKIRNSCDGQFISIAYEPRVTLLAPSMQDKPVLIIESEEEARKRFGNNAKNACRFQLHPDSLLTVEDLADPARLKAKKKYVYEARQDFFCVIETKPQCSAEENKNGLQILLPPTAKFKLHVSNSFTALAKTLADNKVISAYVFACPPTFWTADPEFYKNYSWPAFGQNEAMLSVSDYSGAGAEKMSLKQVLTRVEAEPAFTALFTADQLIPAKEFWSLTPWELARKYPFMYKYRKAASNGTGNNKYQSRSLTNTESLVRTINELKRLVYESEECYLFGFEHQDKLIPWIQSFAKTTEYIAFTSATKKYLASLPCTPTKSLNTELFDATDLYMAAKHTGTDNKVIPPWFSVVRSGVKSLKSCDDEVILCVQFPQTLQQRALVVNIVGCAGLLSVLEKLSSAGYSDAKIISVGAEKEYTSVNLFDTLKSSLVSVNSVINAVCARTTKPTTTEELRKLRHDIVLVLCLLYSTSPSIVTGFDWTEVCCVNGLLTAQYVETATQKFPDGTIKPFSPAEATLFCLADWLVSMCHGKEPSTIFDTVRGKERYIRLMFANKTVNLKPDWLGIKPDIPWNV